MNRFNRQALWIAALLLPLVAASAETTQRELSTVLRSKADAAHGAGLFAQCTACHGADGGGEISGATPRIAGQHYRVLAKQLVDFRHGKRWDFRMEGMADRAPSRRSAGHRRRGYLHRGTSAARPTRRGQR
jgi:cytochrome c553